MDLDFVKAFGSAYIQQNDGGRKVMHHTYRVCVELLDGCEAGQPLASDDLEDLHQSILNLEKKDKRDYLIDRYRKVLTAF